jgi:hypothetical protein
MQLEVVFVTRDISGAGARVVEAINDLLSSI